MDSVETQAQENSSSYSVKLDVFEGPLGLLLFLIKRDEINIYNIPIAHITKQYLEYICSYHLKVYAKIERLWNEWLN
jgi:chromatin segregation and condensation protein Rec8/ScpA/Scc1 (kleisin family)